MNMYRGHELYMGVCIAFSNVGQPNDDVTIVVCEQRDVRHTCIQGKNYIHRSEL